MAQIMNIATFTSSSGSAQAQLQYLDDRITEALGRIDLLENALYRVISENLDLKDENKKLKDGERNIIR